MGFARHQACGEISIGAVGGVEAVENKRRLKRERDNAPLFASKIISRNRRRSVRLGDGIWLAKNEAKMAYRGVSGNKYRDNARHSPVVYQCRGVTKATLLPGGNLNVRSPPIVVAVARNSPTHKCI